MVRSVVDTFKLARPQEYPFLKWISGGADNKPALNNLSKTPTNTKYEWPERTGFPRTTLLAAAIATTVVATLTVTAADGPFMLKDFILLIESTGEQVLVITKGDGAGLVGIQRGWGGTTAATALLGATVRVIGTVHTEGADSVDDNYATTSIYNNFFQEFSREINITEMRMGVEVYAEPSDLLARDTTEKTAEIYEAMETQAWYGKKVDPSGTGKGAMGGFEQYCAAGYVFDASAAALTTTMLQNGMLACTRKTGKTQMPDTLFVGAWGKVKMSQLYQSVPTLYEMASARTGGVVIDTVMTDFGPLDIVYDPFMPESQVALAKSGTIKMGPLPKNELKRKPLAITGTSAKFQISGAYTIEWGGLYTRYLIKNIAIGS